MQRLLPVLLRRQLVRLPLPLLRQLLRLG